MLQHIGPVGNAQRTQRILFSHQNRHATITNLPNGIKNLVLQTVRNTHRGFVEQQQLGCAHQSAANGDHLLLAAR